ncbi:MaoC/PaaZ C-terminal domain-containing protein [Helicobacter anatolicus]|uniref:MaoC/PaaZ C-terminal domain-containing protein n=1 Tax=Helicobacter anatolicus TaxID=2905874 RepID=UPI001E5C6021|nr:MaoC/PaaZ C-terminal domain-containing protein [Helicobacter anatolicus]MCE3040044.1 dehydratase [Helicobacter anatolicus]
MKEYKFSDLVLGMKESFEIKITQEHMDLFCTLSGDENPLHLDEDYAKKEGFDTKVVYGLLLSSLYSRLAGMHLPGKYCLLHSVDSVFLKPAYVGDKLLVEGVISYINEAYKQVEIKASIVKTLAGGGGT